MNFIVKYQINNHKNIFKVLFYHIQVIRRSDTLGVFHFKLFFFLNPHQIIFFSSAHKEMNEHILKCYTIDNINENLPQLTLAILS